MKQDHSSERFQVSHTEFHSEDKCSLRVVGYMSGEVVGKGRQPRPQQRRKGEQNRKIDHCNSEGFQVSHTEFYSEDKCSLRVVGYVSEEVVGKGR